MLIFLKMAFSLLIYYSDFLTKISLTPLPCAPVHLNSVFAVFRIQVFQIRCPILPKFRSARRLERRWVLSIRLSY
jgi:hypothetical protein